MSGKQLTSINGVVSKIANDPAADLVKIQAALSAASNVLRARGESELRLMGLANAPATWVNGSRSILEIAEAMSVEYAAIPADALELYFRVFEKAGVMTIREK